jgi:hypothetical protein
LRLNQSHGRTWPCSSAENLRVTENSAAPLTSVTTTIMTDPTAVVKTDDHSPLDGSPSIPVLTPPNEAISSPGQPPSSSEDVSTASDSEQHSPLPAPRSAPVDERVIALRAMFPDFDDTLL